MFGLMVPMVDNLVIGGNFHRVSLLRSFTLRRLFEAVWMQQRSRSWGR
jgi:hypothetical protein